VAAPSLANQTMPEPLSLKLVVHIVHIGLVRTVDMRSMQNIIRRHQSKVLGKGQVVVGAWRDVEVL
jgi:hypothetical protein